MSQWLNQCFSYWGSGGPLLFAIALVCFGIWGLFARSRAKMLSIRKQSGKLLEHFENDPTLTSHEKIRTFLAGRKTAVATLLGLALDEIKSNAPAFETLSNKQAECRQALGKDIIIVTALTAAAPLLGLLGTVMGMIDTFSAVAAVGTDTGAKVADGISRALITTQFGLVVAVPGVFATARLRRLLDSVQVLMSECQTHILEIIEKHGKERVG